MHKYKRCIYLIIIIVINSLSSRAQVPAYNPENFVTIVSYNVENLFDTIDDPNKDDNEFLPGTKSDWNTDKYKKKLKNLAQVIAAINKYELPEIVALLEIENVNVITDLVNESFLVKADYGIVHQDSPDERGIDVALIYRKSEFICLEQKAIKIFYDFEPEKKTRDILYVKGELKNNEIIHFFVNHWSSRREGQEISESKRLYTAKLLREKSDEIFRKDSKAKIIILGDFNDEPTNKSLNTVLRAANCKNRSDKTQLINLMYDKHILGYGTYFYRGQWNMLDNIVVSQSILSSPGKFEVSFDGGQIFSKSWMMYENTKAGEFAPKPTYIGNTYHAGYSDHLPVYLILKK
jgi:predicted extracellular nuclease